MKVIAFNGSARKNGNTQNCIDKVFEPLIAAGHNCETIHIGGTLLHGCKACGACHQEKTKGKCIIKTDPMNEWIDKMREADVILLASPTYFANVSTEMKALIDRAGYVAFRELKHKIGAPICVERRGGAMNVYNVLMAFFGISQMIVPMSSYWNVGIGRDKGEVLNDDEGMLTMENLGKNIEWLLNKLA